MYERHYKSELCMIAADFRRLLEKESGLHPNLRVIKTRVIGERMIFSRA
jgi:hypothetical protein